MPNRLDLPDDLNRLVEKRDSEEDRRKSDTDGAPAEGAERRTQDDRRQDSQESKGEG